MIFYFFKILFRFNLDQFVYSFLHYIQHQLSFSLSEQQSSFVLLSSFSIIYALGQLLLLHTTLPQLIVSTTFCLLSLQIFTLHLNLSSYDNGFNNSNELNKKKLATVAKLINILVAGALHFLWWESPVTAQYVVTYSAVFLVSFCVTSLCCSLSSFSCHPSLLREESFFLLGARLLLIQLHIIAFSSFWNNVLISRRHTL